MTRSAAVVEHICTDIEARFADRDHGRWTSERDRVQLAVLAAREQARREA